MSVSKSKRITVAEVAKLAGVSSAAVSVALSGRSSTAGVSEATRLRVMQCAEDLGYKPCIIARSLVKSKSYLIGLLCRPVFSWVLPDTASGIQKTLDKYNSSLVIYFHDNDIKQEEHRVQQALERQVDGLIVMPSLRSDGKSNIDWFKSIEADGIPVVQICGHFLEGLAAVTTDGYRAGYLACRHLIELGHKRVVHLTHEKYMDIDLPGAFEDAKERWRGYNAAMNEAGLEPRLVALPGLAGRDDVDSSRLASYELMSGPDKPTAITTYCDYIAHGFMRGLYEMGIRVPDDISIVGGDDQQMSALSNPPLTTMRSPNAKVGDAAARMLFDSTVGRPVSKIMFEPEIIIRSSTAPLNPRA